MKRKILIVDDEKVILTGMSKALRVLCGFEGEVRTVTNGREALVETGHCFYDICFLDINLCDANGLDVMRKINEISPETAIAVMTAEYMPDEMKRAIERDSSTVIPKPVDFLRIRAFLKQTLTGE